MVKIITNKQGFDRLNELVEAYLLNNVEGYANKKDDWNLLKNKRGTIRYNKGNDYILIEFYDVKWYSGFKDVDAIVRGLEILNDEEIPFKMCVSGEEDGVEEFESDNFWDYNLPDVYSVTEIVESGTDKNYEVDITSGEDVE